MALNLNNISKKFSEKSILKDFTYKFDECGLYLIKGESGIGKTTLLRIIAGLDSEYSGTVDGGGIKNVSFMFQEYRLFPTLNALNNADISSKNNSTEAAKDMLIRLGFNEYDLKKKPRELSGGMKQRVAFVRALQKEAPLLILDEPTKELDPDTVNIIVEMIKEEAERRLVLLVTHDDLPGLSCIAKKIYL